MGIPRRGRAAGPRSDGSRRAGRRAHRAEARRPQVTASARSIRRSRRRSRSAPRKACSIASAARSSGDAITFIRELEHLDFVEAVERLAARAGITLRYDDASFSKERQSASACTDTIAEAIDFYHQLLLDSETRGPHAATCGVAASTATSRRSSRSVGLPRAIDARARISSRRSSRRDDIVDAGLAFVNKANKLQDSFRGRVMFPIWDSRGEPVGFGGRALGCAGAEVQEHRHDRALPEVPLALRPALGEGRDRRPR